MLGLFTQALSKRSLVTHSKPFAPWQRAIRYTLGAMALSACGATALSAQETTSVPSSGAILGETRITRLADLNFGQIIPGPSGGSVTIAPNGAVNTTGTIILANNAQQPAEFELERQIFFDFLTFDGPTNAESIQIVSTTDASQTMTVRNFQTDFNRTGFFGLPAYFFRTTYDFRVSGTLDVAPDQAPGVYVGTFRGFIDYN